MVRVPYTYRISTERGFVKRFFHNSFAIKKLNDVIVSFGFVEKVEIEERSDILFQRTISWQYLDEFKVNLRRSILAKSCLVETL